MKFSLQVDYQWHVPHCTSLRCRRLLVVHSAWPPLLKPPRRRQDRTVRIAMSGCVVSKKYKRFFCAPLGKPQSWICGFGWVENGFRPPNGHIGRSPHEKFCSGTNFLRRTLSWASQDPVKTSVREVDFGFSDFGIFDFGIFRFWDFQVDILARGRFWGSKKSGFARKTFFGEVAPPSES